MKIPQLSTDMEFGEDLEVLEEVCERVSLSYGMPTREAIEARLRAGSAALGG